MRLRYLIGLLALLIMIAGCGGSGASGNVNTGGGAIFATDSVDNNAHVWVTIEKVVLTSATGNVTVFDDPTGITIDLRTLADINGKRYSFLSGVPDGTYTGINVTVDKTVTIFVNGNPNGFTRVFAGNNGTTATLSLTFAQPKTLGAGSNLVLDFDLGDWDDNGTTISGNPFLKEGDGNGLNDPNRHEHDEHHGTIANLTGTAPDQTFILVRGNMGVSVTVNANTMILNSGGTMNPVLSNGEQVTVDGAYSVATNSILADWIEIRRDHVHHREAEGTVSTINSAQGSFTLTVRHADGFHPGTTDITVNTTGTTTFQAAHGLTLTQAEFFAAVQAGSRVHVEGTFDSSTSTFTATKVRLQDAGGVDEAEIRGAVSNVQILPRTFDVTVSDWEGINIGNGTVVHVTTDVSTTYKNGDQTMTQGDFFVAIAGGANVEVEGHFDAGTTTMAASKISIRH